MSSEGTCGCCGGNQFPEQSAESQKVSRIVVSAGGDAESPEQASAADSPLQSKPTRRSFFSSVSSVFMAFGLTSGYGMFCSLIGWFLYPSPKPTTRWQYVVQLGRMRVGESMTYVAPSGLQVIITRMREQGDADDFVALSSICPHLGCQVLWEPQNERFFCPCHNGVFDADGTATAGPPAEANQSLLQFPLKVENELLFIDAPVESLI